MEQHLFALFSTHFWDTHRHDSDHVIIDDVDLLHRLSKVLRCQAGDSYIIFDQQHHGQISIMYMTKKNITASVAWIKINSVRSKKITFLLPLLKKDALESAIDSLAQLGVDTIQLIVTAKSRLSLMQPKELARLQAIMIAACEQSKNYQMTQLLPPVPLADVLNNGSQPNNKNSSFDQSIVFDVEGQSFFNIHASVKSSKNICLLIGPEGGLLPDELQLAIQANFKSCALTDTTLRAVQAVAISAALFRLV